MKKRVTNWLQREWYEKPSPNPFLIPLAATFRKIVTIRRWTYRRGVKRVSRLPVPAIVVGNLTVGGTGKTPLIVWLARFLKEKGFRPGIISRGYGAARARQPLQVFENSDPQDVGDEPLLIARRTACPVFVFHQRVEAANALLEKTGCNIILSDDGLQHYALDRDLEIVVVDGSRRFGNGLCLPAGPLREPVERLNSVDMTVSSEATAPGAYAMFLEGEIAVNLQDESVKRPLESFCGHPFVAIAGIGNPGRFFRHLGTFGLQFDCREFPDHHRYRAEDLAFAEECSLVMTEKDAVKCVAFANSNFWYVPVEARLPTEFGKNLLTLLKAKCDGQKIT
ncbi:tetraacyldisaccharide 4'-kinase [Methylocaldum marinum]|uniref:tetraacyldisaccharide 4'-kinase n=1 Tax=Methylocaldum marinum TaxID=1432792 RepID=UPI000E68C1E5